jgi:hypothetical protein
VLSADEQNNEVNSNLKTGFAFVFSAGQIEPNYDNAWSSGCRLGCTYC